LGVGRRREEHDPDRFLQLRGGRFHYRRRVPKEAFDLDERAPVIRIALNTTDRQKARTARDLHEAADNALWASLLLGDNPDAARARWKIAVRRAESLGFVYRPLAEMLSTESVDQLLARVEAVPRKDPTPAVIEAAAGLVARPDEKVTEALKFYFSDIARAELRGKSAEQRKRWKAKREAAVNRFVDVLGEDKLMSQITREDGLKLHGHWMDLVAPADGAPTRSASTGNKNVAYLRILHREYYRHLGDRDRKNPFDDLSFTDKAARKRKRPPLPVEWIRDVILAPGALDALNEEARGILLVMVETGARPSEIANLHIDVIRLDHEVPHVVIEPRDDPEDPREIKTGSSIRIVPLVGVSLAAMRRHPNGFPRYRDNESSWSAAVNKHLRAKKLLPSPKHSAYSLRHSFEDRMKNAKLDEELRRMLMGHTIDRPLYGQGGDMKMWQEELMRLVLPFDASIAPPVDG
jgi:integrase